MTLGSKPEKDNEDKIKPKIVLLEIPPELKQKGVKGIAYGGSLMSIDYKGTIFAFTIYKEDVTRSHKTFYEEFNAEIDSVTKQKIWMCISCSWLRYVYTEAEPLQYKLCAGMSCFSQGKYLLIVMYLNKEGWFCEVCRYELVRAGLVVEAGERE